MAEGKCTATRAARRIRRIAIGVALAWAVWWTSLGLAFSIGALSSPAGLLHAELVISLIPLLSAVIAWQWGAIGAVLLALEGLLVLTFVCVSMTSGHFTFTQVIFALLTMALPPLIAGSLFFASWRRSRKWRVSEGT